MSTVAGGTSASGGDNFRSEYRSRKEQMWAAFARLSFLQRLTILIEESWGMLLFLAGLAIYQATVPASYRLAVWLLDMSAMAQASAASNIPPAAVLGLVTGFYFVLIFIMIGCVLFLLRGPETWTNRHAWAAKTATFLLGFLTKAVEEWMRILQG